ncbi:MAG: hypothetical protein QNK05_02370 [Myxococcota bacterium]|nr:hypothetical protein [Myxococcota bacterium]
MAARPDEDAEALAERIGLCARCEHAQVQRSAKGSEFWRCREADAHPGMLRYPPIPVRACPAFTPSGLPSRTQHGLVAGAEDE